jgi:hypothetical protein
MTRIATFCAALFIAGSMAACGDALLATQVMVLIDAQPGVRTQAETLHIVVRGMPGKDQAAARDPYDRTITKKSGDLKWPYLVALTPLGDDAARPYEVVVTALDTSGKFITQVRAISGYVSHKRLELRLLLEDSCIGNQKCSSDQTCRDGACESARIRAVDLVDYTGETGGPTKSSERDADSGLGGPDRDATAGTTDSGSGGPGGSADGANDDCASVMVAANRRTPEVMLVVDGSGSMDEQFGMGSRWTEFDSALNAQGTGLVTQLDGVVKFGMTIYQRAEVNSCPALTEVPTMLNNAALIASTFQSVKPEGGTPTGEALSAVVAKLPNMAQQLDADPQPRIIILATDGTPNGCGTPPDKSICPDVPPLVPGSPAAPDPFCVANYFATLPPDYGMLVDAARAAKDKGIDVYVIILASGVQQQSELQRVANVGLGLDEATKPGAPIYDAADPMALRDALFSIVGGAVGCLLQIDGKLDVARACSGTVKLDTTLISCDDPNGWHAVDETHIELQGTACTMFESNPTVQLDASWPCAVVTVE